MAGMGYSSMKALIKNISKVQAETNIYLTNNIILSIQVFQNSINNLNIL